MSDWILKKSFFSETDFADDGNRFLVGNGYMGVRGTLEEDRKERLPAINLAGIYDRVGELWREPLNAPNPFYTHIEYGGEILKASGKKLLSHEQSLNYRHGIASRKTSWSLPEGEIILEGERFASLSDEHILAMRYELLASADMDITLFSGIDADVWDINGPHYKSVSFGGFYGKILQCSACTENGEKKVGVSRCDFISSEGSAFFTPLLAGRRYPLSLKAGEKIVLSSICSVFTSNDDDFPAELSRERLAKMTVEDYGRLKNESSSAWEGVWSRSEVEIIGDKAANEAINYSLYHLNCIAPRGEKARSIAARGLSGQTYKGAVFWDTEMFILDYFLLTQPETALSLIKYRIASLPGAKAKALEYGLQGAFYAWESQEGGVDACSDYNVTDVFTGRPVRTYFRDKQVHISSAIVWAIKKYTDHTKNYKPLLEGGAETVIECASFYRSLLLRPLIKDRLELHDVIGPDEYHERVNNNAYTNKMALFVFDYAIDLLSSKKLSEKLSGGYDVEQLKAQFILCRDQLFIPQPNSDGIIEQFDGYFALEDASLAQVKSRLRDEREYWGGGHGVASDTQIIKQADVITMLELFHDEYSEDLIRKNWEFYEPRTEHGSSLSACMYALSACRFGEADLAYPFFMKSACAEIQGGGKQWAGLIYIGGTHPAASGGAWKALVQGFAGLEIRD
ncbi:glycoside hydrolase family 65 protein, partial [Clostridiaceae bacterium OttesenSCG-928-D20]|nr:glycoside hydrolase family 65 protein [Clostridiaceae bacterium OttesenSCG-928-D20]